MDNGTIPAYTKCPFMDKCDFTCGHHGEQHPVEFHSSVAEAFSMMEKEGCDDKCDGCDKCLGAV